MFIEGLLKMYVEDPALFWDFIRIIAPIFIGGLVFGAYVQVREFRMGTTTNGLMWRALLGGIVLSVFWANLYWHVFDVPNFGALLITLTIIALVLSFPLIGGVMTGRWLVNAYRWARRAWQWLRTVRIE